MWWDQFSPEVQERWRQAQREAREIEGGDFICPWCLRYVDPAGWWTHVEANPYEDVDPHDWSFGPTLFHQGCAAPVNGKNAAWVKALRESFKQSPIKPGDYVRLNRRIGKAAAGALCRVIDIEIDEFAGVTEDDPYYEIDLSEPGRAYEERSTARRAEIEAVERPYLRRGQSSPKS